MWSCCVGRRLTVVVGCAEMGEYSHPCEGEMVCDSTLADKVPYFNAPMYLENKTQIGSVEEVFGNTTLLVRCAVVVRRAAPPAAVVHAAGLFLVTPEIHNQDFFRCRCDVVQEG